MARGQILGFSIGFRRRPYNTLALPCECVIDLVLVLGLEGLVLVLVLGCLVLVLGIEGQVLVNITGLSCILLITINGHNVRVGIGFHHHKTSVLNDVIDIDVTDNDVIISWMNMQTP